MKKTNKRKIGTVYEDRTEDYLRKQGYTVLERNFRTRTGEIDIIFRDGETIVFAEVKYRSAGGYGAPEAAVTRSKQQTIFRVAKSFLYIRGIPESVPCRFDVIAVEDPGTFRHLKNAFGGF